MKSLRPLSLFLLFFFLLQKPLYATWSFGEQDLQKYIQPVAFDLDVSSGAVILYEKCTPHLLLRPVSSGYRNSYYMRTTYRRVIKILDKKAFDAADCEHAFYSGLDAGNFAMGVKDVTGTTYNLVEGKVVEEKMHKQTIREEPRTEYTKKLRFSLPAVREGSIIDYSYTIEQPVTLFLVEWSFSRMYPCLYSELDCYLSRNFAYNTLSQSPHEFVAFNDSKLNTIDTTVPYAYTLNEPTFSHDLSHRKWVRRYVESMQPEPFVNNIEDYMEVVKLRVAANKDYSLGAMQSWEEFNERILELRECRMPDKDEIKALQKAAKNGFELSDDPLIQAKNIYCFVRDSAWVNNVADKTEDKRMTSLIRDRNCATVDLNLAAIGLMRAYGLKADLVALSPTSSGKMIEAYPSLDQADYHIGQLIVQQDTFYFDASGKDLPFGTLYPFCYNGYCRVISSPGYPIQLYAERQKERSQYAVVTKDNTPDHYIVEQKIIMNNILAAYLRREWKKDSTKVKPFIDDQAKKLPFKARLQSYQFLGRTDPDTPLTLICQYQLTWPEEKKTVFQPMLHALFKENPLSATKRRFPVELPYASDEFGYLQLQMPEGYKAEELPGSVLLQLDKGNSLLYNISYDPATRMLTLNTRLKRSTVWFSAAEYADVRNFYEKIIEQQQQSCIISKEQ